MTPSASASRLPCGNADVAAADASISAWSTCSRSPLSAAKAAVVAPSSASCSAGRSVLGRASAIGHPPLRRAAERDDRGTFQPSTGVTGVAIAQQGLGAVLVGQLPPGRLSAGHGEPVIAPGAPAPGDGAPGFAASAGQGVAMLGADAPWDRARPSRPGGDAGEIRSGVMHLRGDRAGLPGSVIKAEPRPAHRVLVVGAVPAEVLLGGVDRRGQCLRLPGQGPHPGRCNGVAACGREDAAGTVAPPLVVVVGLTPGPVGGGVVDRPPVEVLDGLASGAEQRPGAGFIRVYVLQVDPAGLGE